MKEKNFNAQEVFENATTAYYEMIATVVQMYDKIFSKLDGFQLTKQQILCELDCFLQALLIKMALADEDFLPIEIEFIKKITDYADVFEEQELTDFANWTNHDRKELIEMVDDFLKEIPTAIMMAGSVDQKNNDKTTYAKTIVDAISNVASALSYIDGSMSMTEKEMFIIGLSPVLEFLGAKVKEEQRTIKVKKLQSTVTPRLSSDRLEKLPRVEVNGFHSLKHALTKALIYIETQGEEGTGMGTGFIISPDGYAVTCAHITKGATSILTRLQINGAGGPSICCPAKVICEYPEEDLALIELDAENLPYMKLYSKNNAIETGEDIILLGYPFGKTIADSKHKLNYNIAKGVISSRQIKDGIERMMLDVNAKSGDSGGPIILKETGEVVGVLLGSEVRGKDFKEELNFMRPIQYVWEKFTK